LSKKLPKTECRLNSDADKIPKYMIFINLLRFPVLKETNKKTAVSQYIFPCILLEGYQHFRGISFLYHANAQLPNYTAAFHRRAQYIC
jgi:hypothetical protein